MSDERFECWACGLVQCRGGILRHLYSWAHYRGVARKIGWWKVLRTLWEGFVLRFRSAR